MENSQPVQPSQNSDPNTVKRFQITPTLVIFMLAVAGVASVVGYFVGANNQKSAITNDPSITQPVPTQSIPEGVACTMDAKICPDGSAVGRQGPNCEFAECPSTPLTPRTDNKADWKTYSDATYSFKYPPTWTVKPGETGQEEYYGGDSVEIISPSTAVTVELTPSQSPYGFGGPIPIIDGEAVSITVNGEAFQGIEKVRTEEGVKKVFVDMPVTIGGKNYYIMFGTGYPVNDNQKASYDDYIKYKPEIIQILSTLGIATK